MFGVMGISAEFAQAAGRAGKKQVNKLRFVGSDPDVHIYALSCNDTITIESTKNGETVVEEYSNLESVEVAIQSDANTTVTIKGCVTELQFIQYEDEGGDYYSITSIDTSKAGGLNILGISYQESLSSLDLSANTALTALYCNNCAALGSLNLSANTALTTLYCASTALSSLDLSANTALTTLDCSGCSVLSSLDLSANTALTTLNCNNCTVLSSLDLSDNAALTTLDCNNCAALGSLNLSANTALTTLNCGSCKGLSFIYYPATNSNVATKIASAITAATDPYGTVYTDSDGAYYSTIETAATAKGWTIEQLA